MSRVLLVLVLLTVPAQAAPRLKDRKPIPDPEGARIAALKARYDEIRKSGTPEKKYVVANYSDQFRVVVSHLDALSRQERWNDHLALESRLNELMCRTPRLRDLYEIAVYDHKKAAGKK
jgi:hypothetical protein